MTLCDIVKPSKLIFQLGHNVTQYNLLLWQLLMAGPLQAKYWFFFINFHWRKSCWLHSFVKYTSVIRHKSGVQPSYTVVENWRFNLLSMNLFFLQDRLWDAFVLHVKFSTLSHLSQIVTQDGTMCNYWTMSLWLCDGRNVTGNKMFNMNKIIFSWILWPAQCTIRANIF